MMKASTKYNYSLTLLRRLTDYCVVDDLNRLKTSLYARSTKETFPIDFLEILKLMLRNF